MILKRLKGIRKGGASRNGSSGVGSPQPVSRGARRADRPRSTSYPQALEGPAPAAGKKRTTSYPSALQNNRRGVDSIN